MNQQQTAGAKWLNDEIGFAFIERSSKDDLFAHKNSINKRLVENE